MHDRLAAVSVCLAAALLAGCAGPVPAEPPAISLFETFTSYSAMGADRSLASAIYAVERSCPLRMADALAGAVKGINAAPERSGRPPATLDTPDPPSFISLYNRIASEEPRIDPRRLLRHAVDGMTRALDPELQLPGYVNLKSVMGPSAGIGLEMKSEAGQIIVVDAIPDSPAARGGIKAGDRVMAVDATETTNLYLDEVVEKLQGEEGSSVELTIRRDGQAEELKVPLTRQIVRSARPRPELRIQERIAIITLPNFDPTTSKDLADAIRKAQQAGVAGYIVDIRNNGGGLLDQIIETASMFLEGGRVLSTAPPAECGSTQPREDYTVLRRVFKLNESPMIVLIGKDTGSGAELFAAAMSESGRARLVGQTTAGKGVVHTVIPLGNNAAMRLKTAELITSQGARITGVGVKPTVEAPESGDALARALQLLATPD